MFIVAKAMISKGFLQFNNQKFMISRPSKLVSLATVLVENINKDITRGDLMILFQNKIKSGGGNIVNLEYNAGDEEALIIFENLAGICCR